MHTEVCIMQIKVRSYNQFWGAWFIWGHVSSTNNNREAKGLIDSSDYNPALASNPTS